MATTRREVFSKAIQYLQEWKYAYNLLENEQHLIISAILPHLAHEHIITLFESHGISVEESNNVYRIKK